LKHYFFTQCEQGKLENEAEGKVFRFEGLSTHYLKSIKGKVFSLDLNRNHPLVHTSRDYLTLGVLKDDPQYKDKKFKAGDTVAERYEAWNEYWKEFLKDWALNGLWLDMASSSYDYHSYPSYFNLMELAPDPVVRTRARMFLDLSLIENEQISISGVRGGLKSRAKNGGLGNSFDRYRAMLYGERGSIAWHSSIAASLSRPLRS
jgi:hypothetical protein